jgi:glycosyltransferase involved in cell wall biosynthesis
VLATVHASIVLATEPDLVKAYPHSLLDSMAAGKPVLVSRAIPMAQYVAATGCGQIVEQVDAAAILAAVDALVANYSQAQFIAQRLGQQDFSQQSMITSYQQVYEQVLKTNDQG